MGLSNNLVIIATRELIKAKNKRNCFWYEGFQNKLKAIITLSTYTITVSGRASAFYI